MMQQINKTGERETFYLSWKGKTFEKVDFEGKWRMKKIRNA